MPLLVGARRELPLTLFLLTLALGPVGAQDEGPAIADNSFFIEEAYNQEPGVVQHINTFTVAGARDRDLFYTFTQEWPFRGQTHQLSYTLPVSRADGRRSGFGDALLNYRLQLGGGERTWALAPRVSVVLPTGSVSRGYGDGSVGMQVNLPLSLELSRDIVTHWNAGATVLPWALGPSSGGARPKRTLTHGSLGSSIVGPTRAPVQFLVEQVVLFEEEIGPGGRVDGSTAWVVSPGARAAINVGATQLVPGIAVPFTRSGGRTERDLFLYLSIEHPFRTTPITSP
jgi:hypothetical protein